MNGKAAAMKRWLRRNLGCLCLEPEDDDDTAAAPVADPGVQELRSADDAEEARRAAEAEALRKQKESERAYLDAVAKLKKAEADARGPVAARQQTAAETALARFPEFAGVDADISDQAEKAAQAMFGAAAADVYAVILAKLKGDARLANNLQLVVVPLKDGVQMRVALKHPDVPADTQEAFSIDKSLLFANSEFKTDPATQDRIMHLERLNAKGQASFFFEGLLDVALAARVARMTVHAVEVGAYTWVRYGFVPDADSWKKVCARAQGRLDDAGKLGRPGAVSKDAMKAARAILKKLDPLGIRDLAGLKADVEGTTSKLGYLLLENNDWDGVLQISDQEAVREVRAYIEERKQAFREKAAQ